jgi:geranylgeranyl pyrophosphate synthase
MNVDELGIANLAEVLEAIRQHAVALAHAEWAELGRIVETVLPNPIDPVALVPVATGIAWGASVEALIPVAAATLLMVSSLRIVDDYADQDDPDALDRLLGGGRAMNAALGLSTLSTQAFSRLALPSAHRETLLKQCLQASLQICHGQDTDISARVRTLPDYERIVQLKTVAGYEFAALAGAGVATTDPASLAQSQACGAHLGWMTQILDDIEALWFMGERNDLQAGRFTFPILYALAQDHPLAQTLRQLCSAEAYDHRQICAALDAMDIRFQLMTLALNHRDAALTALGGPRHPGGRVILQFWLDWLFRDGARLLPSVA